MQPMLDTSHLPRVPEWKKAGDFEDILYEKSEEGIAKITINRHIDVSENYANNMRLFEASGCGALLISRSASAVNHAQA